MVAGMVLSSFLRVEQLKASQGLIVTIIKHTHTPAHAVAHPHGCPCVQKTKQSLARILPYMTSVISFQADIISSPTTGI